LSLARQTYRAPSHCHSGALQPPRYSTLTARLFGVVCMRRPRFARAFGKPAARRYNRQMRAANSTTDTVTADTVTAGPDTATVTTTVAADAQVIDRDGYRKNVGLIVCNHRAQVLWARRVRRDGWQFPQGGVRPRERALDAALRELHEEIGLRASDVRLLGATGGWLRYEVPGAARALDARRPARFRGQKQKWFLFKLIADESSVRLDASPAPEFDRWRWIDYWHPLQQIVAFKRPVYRAALLELAPLLPGAG